MRSFLAVLCACLLLHAPLLHAQVTTHGIWSRSQDSWEENQALARFRRALASRGLGEPQVLGPPLVEAPEAAKLHAVSQAAFAIHGQLRGTGKAILQLTLVRLSTGESITSTSVPLESEFSMLSDAILRLDEEAHRRLLHSHQPKASQTSFQMGLPPQAMASPPALQDNPKAWARTRWPLLTAISLTAGTALMLGIIVAASSD